MRPRAALRCVCLVAPLLLGSPGPAAAQFTLRPVISGLSFPVDFVQDPARPGVQYVVELGGFIRVVVDGALRPAPLLDLRAAISTGGERGLLGLAFPPDYAASRRFFVNFTNRDGHTVVARFRHRLDDPFQADPSSRFDLEWSEGQRFIPQPSPNHNGGKILFGADGFLYIGMGDGGGGGDPDHNAQNPNLLLGKMLRIDVDVADDDVRGYRVPPDNPFAGARGPVSARPEIWAFGLRNPWRFSVDPPALGGTGALVVADVGQETREEIDYEPRGRGGRNYGWRNFEGRLPNVQSLPPAYTPLQAPMFDYGHDEGRSVSGGVVYRGRRLGASYRGRYFFADFIARRVWSLGLSVDPVSGEAQVADRQEHTGELGGGTAIGNPTSIGVDAGGEMYLVDWSGGRVLRFESAEPDTDGDTLPDSWERELGLDPLSAMGADGAGGDPDGDGRTNAEEYAADTHPRGTRQYYLAEGAQSAFFDVTCAVANPGPAEAHVLVSFNGFDGRRVTRRIAVPGRSQAHLDAADVPEVADTAFGLTIEADTEVAVDRTMRWPGRSGQYGAHAETATPQLSATWYLAEGATHSAFSLFYLFTNPNLQAADVKVTYLRPAPLTPIVKSYRVPPQARYTVWVNQEDPGLKATDVAAVIETSPSTPLIVERAMYRDGGGRMFDAGHASLGLPAPALRWYLAEGATGNFFDTFVLLANPGTNPAAVRARFLLPDGAVVERLVTVAARSRLTLWVDALDPRLASTGVSVVIESENGEPVVVERAMWWPGPTPATWTEASASGGVTEPAARWLVAGGESGGPRRASTWLLIANTGPGAVVAQVTLLPENGAPVSRPVDLAPTSRFGVDAATLFPEAQGHSYGMLVEAADPAGALIVERATYWDAPGGFWAAGANAVALPLR